MKRKIGISIAILFMLAVSSPCTSQQNISTQEYVNLLQTPTIASTSEITTPEIVLSPTIETIMPTLETSINLPDFGSIGAGQYVLVQTSKGGDIYLQIISTDKTISKKIPLNANIGISNDGTQLLIMQPEPKSSYIYSFTDKSWHALMINKDCINAAWSSNKGYIALACVNGYVEDIYLLDTKSLSMIQITNCLEIDNSCSKPALSMDGEWLAYFRNDERSGIHQRGIQVFNTNCIQSNSCMTEQTNLIQSDSNAVWSLTNQLIVSNQGIIQFLKLNDSNFILQDQVDIGLESFIDIAHSPDGNYLIYTSDSDTVLNQYTIPSGTSEVLFSFDSGVQIVGWIVIQ